MSLVISGSCEQYRIEGVPYLFCVTGWTTIFGIARASYFRYKKELRDPSGRSGRAARDTRLETPLKTETIRWMKEYFDVHAEPLPNNQMRHLHHLTLRGQVFEIYRRHCVLANKTMVTMSYFLALWKEKFPLVKIPKVTRFAKCDSCISHQTLKTKPNQPKEVRETLHRWHMQHINDVRTERLKYRDHKFKAIKHPERYMCLIVDGMGSHMQSIPQYKPKRSDAATIWDYHIVGVIDHMQHRSRKFAFVAEEEVPHDPNLTFSCVFRVLASRFTLPPVLYLQVPTLTLPLVLFLFPFLFPFLFAFLPILPYHSPPPSLSLPLRYFAIFVITMQGHQQFGAAYLH
jgi:hypothetical protein